MAKKVSKFFFDKRDHELISIVNEVLRSEKEPTLLRRTYFTYFHPNGIKEMAESNGLRIAYAAVHLLRSLEIGGLEDRINALLLLRDEVIETAGGMMPKNTARVLLSIMKDLVRSHGDYHRQLELAHDFRTMTAGKPRIVRKALRRYHLLEMPEEWNQIAFDDHVHDVNTKGRKSSTHLIMDAWIKGIRRLRIIHYNYIEPRFAEELFQAAKIMGIDVRIGIEFSARFRNQYVQLIWAPRGFADTQAFLAFFSDPSVMQFFEEGREVSRYQQQYVMALLRAFNTTHRKEIEDRCQIDLLPLDETDFINFVGIGQKSTLHLEKFIHNKILDALKKRAQQLKEDAADNISLDKLDQWLVEMDALDIDTMVNECLKPENNPSIPNPNIPDENRDAPALLRLSPPELLDRLNQLHSGYRITLNLTNLKAEDVLELLYDCKGMITRLEIFNLKDHAAGKSYQLPDINRLQQAINDGSAIALKRFIRHLIEKNETSEIEDREARIEKLTVILHDIVTLKGYYKASPLKARIGSDSTGRSPRMHGMGLAIIETLPVRAQREIFRHCDESREIIPITITAYRNTTFIPYNQTRPIRNTMYRLATLFPFLRWLGFRCREGWEVQSPSTRMENPGNVVTLGGIQKQRENGLISESAEEPPRHRKKIYGKYLNSTLKNILKVLIGFIPAFATFALTKDWWLLAYFGAPIWFGITGLRNILQSVLGGGGFRRSPFLRWNDYVSWERITDSLLFTGFSVPLLDYIVKTLILDRSFNITTTTSPVLLYAFMALANGIYLSSHNAFRGLPRGAIFGNFFRSILSIPIAVAFNAATGGILVAANIQGIDTILQKWAAIISKTASDFVAGIIEGSADRLNNIQMRYRDYRKKFTQLLDIYARLELLFPEVQTLKILQRSSKLKESAGAKARELEKIIIIHALDLLYFWMYQPRSRSTLKNYLNSLSEEERHIFVNSQFTLQRHRHISQMFIDGILGNNFPGVLSFYLSRHEEYLEAIKKMSFHRN